MINNAELTTGKVNDSKLKTSQSKASIINPLDKNKQRLNMDKIINDNKEKNSSNNMDTSENKLLTQTSLFAKNTDKNIINLNFKK